MRKITCIFLITILSSCYLFKENGIDFKIVNKSNGEITNIILKTSENIDSTVVTSIQPQDTKSGFLRMGNTKSDGSYVLEFTNSKGEKVFTGGGYYTNGGSLDSWIRFEIREDTTLVDLGQYP